MKILIAIPAYNEALIIGDTVRRVCDFMHATFAAADWRVVVADNHSTDATAKIVKGMINEYPRLEYLYVAAKGKGRAIRAAWEARAADVYVFMDADLATDLAALPFLVAAVATEGYAGAYGSRFHPASRVTRSWSRKVFSWGYRCVLKALLGVRMNDAPCGFKAIGPVIKSTILPQVENNEWFFDSELMILSERAGLKLKEIPVAWSEHNVHKRQSQVKVFSITKDYFLKVLALRRRIS